MGNQIYKEISKFAEMQRDEIKREKAKKKRKSVCIDPDSVIGKEIMYQTALLHIRDTSSWMQRLGTMVSMQRFISMLAWFGIEE